MTNSYNSIMKLFSFVKKISDVKMASDQNEYCVESFLSSLGSEEWRNENSCCLLDN